MTVGEWTTKLVQGKTYRVAVDDCCIDAVFSGRFQGWLPSDDGTIEHDQAVFAIGALHAVRIGPEWSDKVTVVEVPDPDTVIEISDAPPVRCPFKDERGTRCTAAVGHKNGHPMSLFTEAEERGFWGDAAYEKPDGSRTRESEAL